MKTTSITIKSGDTLWGISKRICNNDSSLNIQEVIYDIKEINIDAFTRLRNLENIKVAFGNIYFDTIDGILYTKDFKKLVYCPLKLQTETFNVPTKLEIIGEKAFYDNENILSIKTFVLLYTDQSSGLTSSSNHSYLLFTSATKSLNALFML